MIKRYTNLRLLTTYLLTYFTFISDIAKIVLKRDVKLQLSNLLYLDLSRDFNTFGDDSISSTNIRFKTAVPLNCGCGGGCYPQLPYGLIDRLID